MPFLLTEAAVEAHQKELEQEAQPVLLYGASSPRHSPQHHESPPAARGGFAGFFGSLVSSIGKRGVFGGSKLSAQPTAGCTSPLLKNPDVSQFSNFSHGSRLDRFLTDAAKSAVVAGVSPSAPSRTDGSISKFNSNLDRSSLGRQADHISRGAKEEELSGDIPRRRSVSNFNSAPTLAPAVSNLRPLGGNSSSGSARSNSASSLSSDDAIRHSSQALKPISAQTLLSASVQAPTLSEIRSRISMLDGAAREQQSQQSAVAVAKDKPSEQKQHRPLNPHLAPAVTPVPSYATASASPSSLQSPLVRTVEASELLPPYALLQPAPQTAVNRSKWKQVSETASAATLPTQGGWHYRSVKKSSDSPEVHPPSSVTIATGTVASTPPWLKVDNSPVQVSPAAAPSPLFESPAGTRTSRRHTVDVVSAPSPVVSAPNAALSAEDQTDKHFVGESSAAAQRRARQNTFFQTQRLSPTKTYTKDYSAVPRQDEVIVKSADVPVAVAVSAGSAVHGQGATHVSPGQVFNSLKVATCKLEPAASGLSTKELSQQLSQDLSERLERIQRTHSGLHVQQQQKYHPQPENDNLGSQPQRESSLSSLNKPPAAISPSASAAAPSFASDSLLQFVSKMDSRTNAAAIPHTVSRILSSNPSSLSENAFGRSENAPVPSLRFVEKGMDSLEVFVRDKLVATGSSLLPVALPPAKSSIQAHSGPQKHSQNDLPRTEVSLKPLPSVTATTATTALQMSESRLLQNAPTDSLYRIDSASPPLDTFDSSNPQALHQEADQGEDDDDYQFDNSWLLQENASPAIHVAVASDSSSTRKTAFHATGHEVPMDGSTSVQGRSRCTDHVPPDVPSWLLPTSPTRVPLSKKDDFDDFVGSFTLNGSRDSFLRGTSHAPKARDNCDDFEGSFDVTKILNSNSASEVRELSHKYDSRNGLEEFTPSFDVSKIFLPVPQSNLRESKAASVAVPHVSARVLSEGARYIARDSQGIELLAAAIKKVSLPNCRPLSGPALNALLTTILRKFDLPAFANKCKIPLIMAADMVQLAPFSLHFVVDDSGNVLNGTNWKDAQTLLEECVDFVSLVNSYGCSISFLSSSISQASLKAKDQVAQLFAQVVAAASTHRFTAVPKPNVVAAFESKVFDPVFAGSNPALVYVLSLQDSVSKRDYLSADGMLRVHQALDVRIANRNHSNLVAQFVRLSVVAVGQGTRNGFSDLLSELRSNVIVGPRMTFVEDFECDAEVCHRLGVQLTPYIYVLKLLLSPVDENYLD